MSDEPSQDAKRNALEGIAATLGVHEAAWCKLGKVIALIRVIGGDLADANRLRARASQRVTFYNRLFLEVRAAGTIVSAPTPQQIQATRKLIRRVENIAVADAATRVGLDLISDVLSEAAATARTVDLG